MTQPRYDLPVWPRPQEVKGMAAPAALSLPLKLRVAGAAPWLAKAARAAVTAINRIADKRMVVSGASRGATLTLTDTAGLPKGLRAVRQAEGYLLSITAEGVLLAGNDAKGVQYGAHTFGQLSRAGDLPLLTVRDWPRFPVRGVHMYLPAREQFPFFLRFLDFMVEMKLNTLVLEIGGGMQYEKHPEINRAWEQFCRDARAYNYRTDTTKSKGSRQDWGWHEYLGPNALQTSRYFWKDSTHTELAGGTWLTKDEVRQLKTECDRRHIEIIPEVQSLSHAYYLCCAHPEIAERADDPWPDTYCPSNPKSYQLLFDVMQEVIDLFQPRIMHIGHDEAYTFRVCPNCRKHTGHDILAGDLNKIHDFLAERGIRTFLWGDKLMNITLPNGERHGGVPRSKKDPVTGKKAYLPATYKAVEKVPADLLICDWYWSLDPHSAQNFHKHGFDVIYGNFHPLSFEHFEQRSDLPYVLGAEMSTWCGVTPYEFGHNGAFHHFFPGADMLWRGKQMPRAQVCARMATWMTQAVERLAAQDRWLVSGGKGKARPVELRAAARPLPESLAGKVKCGAQVQTVLGTGTFTLLTAKGALEQAVLLDRAQPESAPVTIGGKADRLLLLHGTTLNKVYYWPTYYSYQRGPADVLQCRVAYADGKRETFSAIFGEDIGPLAGDWPTHVESWDQGPGYCYRAVPVPAGPGHTFFAQEWVNPRPDVPIASVTFTLGPDATEEGKVIVAAVTTVR